MKFKSVHGQIQDVCMFVGGSGMCCDTIGMIITKPHGQITYDCSRRVKRMAIFTGIVGSRAAGGVVGT